MRHEMKNTSKATSELDAKRAAAVKLFELQLDTITTETERLTEKYIKLSEMTTELELLISSKNQQNQSTLEEIVELSNLQATKKSYNTKLLCCKDLHRKISSAYETFSELEPTKDNTTAFYNSCVDAIYAAKNTAKQELQARGYKASYITDLNSTAIRQRERMEQKERIDNANWWNGFINAVLNVEYYACAVASLYYLSPLAASMAPQVIYAGLKLIADHFFPFNQTDEQLPETTRRELLVMIEGLHGRINNYIKGKSPDLDLLDLEVKATKSNNVPL
jgi:hypothetical protein